MPDTLTGTYTSNFSGTVMDDVEGIIQMISPTKTPFMSSIGKAKATNTYHEWLEDELRSPAANAAVEGADATATSRTQPSRLGNYTQILQDSYLLSGTSVADGLGTIGRKVERYEADKAMKALALDLEYALINNASSAAGNATTARQMKGMEGFVSTNDKSYGSYALTNDFSEAKLMDMSQACYVAGGDPSILLVPPAQARKIASWNNAGKVTINTNASEQTLVMAVMVLETPFGRMKVAIDRYIVQDTSTDQYDRVYVYDPERWSLATFRPFRATQLAKTGDSVKYQALGEYTLVCHNEKASAKCKKCATD